MLRELRIENLLLIERAELRLAPGLNAITGETGAGKTVLAHSLDLLLGGKPRSGIVRPGADEAWVEGCFDLDPALREEPELAELLERVPDGKDVVLARRLSAAGRSSAYVAGRAASAADLRALGGRLLTFYGQHEHRKLTLAAAQAAILDAFAGPEHLEILAAYREAHSEATGTARELCELREREGARERDLDLLRFELGEIEEAAPDPAELAELGRERERLNNAESLRAGAGAALAAISGSGEDGIGAASALAAAEAAVGQPAGADPALAALRERLSVLSLEVADVGAELRDYVDGLEADPGRLDQVEGRLAAVERLLRKHGGDVEAVLAYAERCRARIDELDRAEERSEELAAALAAAEAERARLGERVSVSRERAARELERAVSDELAELAMAGASFEATLVPRPEGFGPTGRERVELRVATNPGLPLTPLRETASGGELSRIMLALAGLAAESEGSTLVFDEIDAGIGGQVARRVGERLRALGEKRQVLCITHLPQVASQAAAHFVVTKEAEGEMAHARVEPVGGEELVAEIVRMLGAEGGDETAARHARELLAA